MEREQFKVLVKAMKAVYAQPTFIPDQDAFNVWFALLRDLPYKQAELAVQKHMATEKFPPTIADIREKAEQITSVKETEMSELEAWAIVRKAIGRSNYYAEEEFEKLPEACKMAVGNPSNLREWAMMDSDQVGTVEQSHFVRNYRTAMQRIKWFFRCSAEYRTRSTHISARIRAIIRTVTGIAQYLIARSCGTEHRKLGVINTNTMPFFQVRAVIMVYERNPSRQYNSPPVYYSARMSL